MMSGHLSGNWNHHIFSNSLSIVKFNQCSSLTGYTFESSSIVFPLGKAGILNWMGRGVWLLLHRRCNAKKKIKVKR
jgi:hypothetical protein